MAGVLTTLLHEPLPPPWNYAVVDDGRVFFINEESRTTSWLHPVYGHPVQTGHSTTQDLPRGWEMDTTEEGAPFYIDHIHERTTFAHPMTGETAAVDMSHNNSFQQHQQQPQQHQHQHQQPQHQHQQQQQQHQQQKSPQQRPQLERQKSDKELDHDDSSKKKTNKILDRPPSATRREDSPVSMRGWLYKQDSGPLKAWKKRWFVLSDFCLFYYKGPEEGKSQGSVLLPSYRINPCQRQDGINRKHAFKAEHDNMRTYYFAAESEHDMRQWMNAMSLASILQRDPSVELELNQRAPTREAGQDESFQSSGSSDRPHHTAAPAARWTSEDHYNEASFYQQGHPDYQQHTDFDTSGYPGDHPAHSEPQGYPQGQGYLQDYPKGQGLPQEYLEGQDHRQGHPASNGHSRYRGEAYGGEEGEEEDPMFYQPGQLHKQRPLTDLSQFDSNMDIPRYDPRGPRDEPDQGVFTPYGNREHHGYGGSNNHLAPPSGHQYDNSRRDRNSYSGSNRNLLSDPQRASTDSYQGHSQAGQRHTGQDLGYNQGSQQDMHRHPGKNLQNNNNPIYENLNASGMSPGRPPLPVTYRDQIVRDIADSHSPGTQQDLITAEQRSQMRHQMEPLVFQYPEVTPGSHPDSDSWRGSQKEVPEAYIKAKQAADARSRGQEEGYRGPDPKRQSSASQRSEPTYSTIPEKGLSSQHPRPPPHGDKTKHQQPLYVHTGDQQHTQQRPLTKLTHYDLSPESAYRNEQHQGQRNKPNQQWKQEPTHIPTSPSSQDYNIKLESKMIDLPVQPSSPIAKSAQLPPWAQKKDVRHSQPGSDSTALKKGMGTGGGYSGLPYSPRQQRKFSSDLPNPEPQRQRSRSSGASFTGKFAPGRDSWSFNRTDSTASASNPKHSTPLTSATEMPSLPYSSLTQREESSLAVGSPSYPEENYPEVNIPDFRYSWPEDYMMSNPLTINTNLPAVQVPRGSDSNERQARPHSYAPAGYAREASVEGIPRPASYVFPHGMPDSDLAMFDQRPQAAGSASQDGLVYARLAFVKPEPPRQAKLGPPVKPKKDYIPGQFSNGAQHPNEQYMDNQYQNLPWNHGVDRPMPRPKSLSAFTQVSGRSDGTGTLERKNIDNDTLMAPGSPFNPGSLTRSKSGSHIYDNPEASADMLRAKAKALTASYYTKSPPSAKSQSQNSIQHQKSQSWSITNDASPPVSSVAPQPRSANSTPRGYSRKPKAVADLRPAFQNAASEAGLLKIKDHPSQDYDGQKFPARPQSVTLPEKVTIDERDELLSKRPRSVASPEGTTARIQRDRSRGRDRNRDRSRDRSKSRDRSQSRDRSLSRSRDRVSGVLDSDEEWPPKSRTITIPGKEPEKERPRSIATSSVSPQPKAGILRNGTSLPSSPIMQRRPPGTITIPGRSESAKELNKIGGSRTDLDSSSSSPKKNKSILSSSKREEIPQRPKSIAVPTRDEGKQSEEAVNWTNKRPKSVTIMEFNGQRQNATPTLESPNIRKLNLNELDRPYGSSKDNVYSSKSASQSSLRNLSPEPKFKVLPWIDLPELRNSTITSSTTQAEKERIRQMDPARSYLSWAGQSQGLGVSPWPEPEPLGAEEVKPIVTQNVGNVRATKSMESLNSTQRQQQATIRPMNWTSAAPEASMTHQKAPPPPQSIPPKSPAMPLAYRTPDSYRGEPESQNASYNPYNSAYNNSAFNNTTGTTEFDITTIKEDPTMEDNDVLVTKKLEKLKESLNGHRLRLSISAGDLVGKSHEELVLLLIQLRRSQSRLGDAHGWYRKQMEVGRDVEKEYRRRRESQYDEVPEPLEEEHQQFETLRHGSTQVQKQADISKPLINLVDNLVTMGSLYGGNNPQYASQYKQHILRPGQYVTPKKMIDFSRQHQEVKLTKEQEEQLKQLQEDEADLEEKLQQLYQLDRELQEHSFAVTSLQEDWELLQKALEGIKNQSAQETDPRGVNRLAQQRKTIEQELSKVRQQLADASKRLEETAADNARVENEVLLLRKKIMRGLDNGGLDRPLEEESLRTKEQLEAELTSVQTMIDGLSKQGAKLGQVMTSLRRSMPDLSEEPEEAENEQKPYDKKPSGPTYAETDLDSMETRDLGNNQRMTLFKDKTSTSRPMSHVHPNTMTKPVREIVSPPESVPKSYSQPQLSPALSSPHSPYSKSTPALFNGNAQHPNYSHSVHGSYSGGLQHPQPPVGINEHHVRQSSLPVSLPGSASHRGHSSMIDLRARPTSNNDRYQPPSHPISQHQQQGPPHRPASATFGHRPSTAAGSYSHRGSHNQGSTQHTYASEPNLAQPESDRNMMPPPQSVGSLLNEPLRQQNNVRKDPVRQDSFYSDSGRQDSFYNDSQIRKDDPYSRTNDSLRSWNPQSSRPGDPQMSYDSFYNDSTILKGQGAHRNDSYRSDPPSQEGSQRGSVTSQAVAYNQPASIAYSEPYGRERSASLVYHPADEGPSSLGAPDYVNIGPSGEVNSEIAPDGSSSNNNYSAMDISEADDNMKRFYGILPRDKPRAMTVRDIKKRENERRGRERGRRSYADEEDEEIDIEQLVADNTFNNVSNNILNSAPRSWKSSSMPRISSSGIGDMSDIPSHSWQPPSRQQNNAESSLQRAGSSSSMRSSGSNEDKRRSATERLFGAGRQYDPSSVERVRRMSDIFTPKPFNASTSSGSAQIKGYRPVSMFNLSTQSVRSDKEDSQDVKSDHGAPSPPPPPPPPLPSSAAIATVRPVFTSSKPPSRSDSNRSINTATVKPMKASVSSLDDSVFRTEAGRDGGAGYVKGRKVKDRDRRLTVSSSKPMSMESPILTNFRNRHRSAAGDLITSTVKSETKDPLDFDDLTIEKEVLFVPDKVEIPERYMPDSDDEVTEEEAIIRQEKSEKFRKLLAAQSLQEWRENELSESNSRLANDNDPSVQKELREEKRRREQILDIRQALAREVSQKTREVAEMRRRATSEMELRYIGEQNHPGDAESFLSLLDSFQRSNLMT